MGERIKVHQELINVALSTDDNYACHTAAAIASVLYNANKSDRLHFFIMGNISKKVQNNFRKLKKIKQFEITFFPVDESKLEFLKKVNISSHVSLATYYKLFMPDFFPNIDKMLWLDSDLIVLKSLKDFWDIDIEDYYFGAVPDIATIKYTQRLETPPGFDYVNTGTFLMNLKNMRKENALSHMIDYIENNYQKLNVADQCIINGSFYNKIKIIEHQWNFYHEFYKDFYNFRDYKYENTEEYARALQSPGVIHFVGPQKPWIQSTVHPYKREYWKYLRKTAWASNYRQYVSNQIKIIFSKLFYTKENEYCKTYFALRFRIWKKLKNREVRSYELLNKMSDHIKWQNEKLNCLEWQLSQIGSQMYNQEEKIDVQNKKIDGLDSHLNWQNEKITKWKDTFETFSLNIPKMLSVFSLHSKTFPKYKNINQGKEVVLVATGPTLQQYSPIADAIHIGVNSAFKFDKTKLDYLFIQDYSHPTKDYIKFVNDYLPIECKKFYGLIPYSQCVIPEDITIDSNAERFYSDFCREPAEFTFDISTQAFGDAYSVVFPAMQFILWTNPKKIYLVGCDCSLSGYFYNSELTGHSDKNFLRVEQCIDGWNKFKEFAQIYYPNIEIISINPVGLKGLFKDIYTKENKNGECNNAQAT